MLVDYADTLDRLEKALGRHFADQNFIEQFCRKCSLLFLLLCGLLKIAELLGLSLLSKRTGNGGRGLGGSDCRTHGQSGGHGESLETKRMNHRLIIIQAC